MNEHIPPSTTLLTLERIMEMLKVCRVSKNVDNRTGSDLLAVFFIFFSSLISPHAIAEIRNLPEEIRALAVICSSGSSTSFRGQIEGGLNKLFGKVIEGTGELELSKNETDFLNNFKDESLRVEARKVYNDCVKDTLRIIYNRRNNKNTMISSGKLLVPDGLTEVHPGQKFALRLQESVSLLNGGIFSVERTRHNGLTPAVNMSNGSTGHYQFKLGSSTSIPNNRECRVTFYSRRHIEKNSYIYSFQYDCPD